MVNGFTFEYAYRQVPLRSPSRTSFFTGLRPDTARVWQIGPYFRDKMPNNTGKDVITLSQYFKDIGNYWTVGSGKIRHPGSSSGGWPHTGTSEGGGDEMYGSRSEPYFFFAINMRMVDCNHPKDKIIQIMNQMALRVMSV